MSFLTGKPYRPQRYRPADYFLADLTPLQRVACTGAHDIDPNQWEERTGQPTTDEARALVEQVDAAGFWWEQEQEEVTDG